MNEKFYNYRWNAKKEKEEKEMAQLQAQQQQQQQMAAKWNSGRGRGYRPTPYYYGGNDQQYGQAGIRQQYAGGQAAMGFAYMDGGSQATGHYSGNQMMGQPGQFGGQYAPRQQAPQGGGYYPPPQLVRGPRPPTRANAECFSCGVVGHFSRDGSCIQQDVEAHQARKVQQIAAAAAQIQVPAAAGAQQQLTYVAPGAGDPTGSG